MCVSTSSFLVFEVETSLSCTFSPGIDGGVFLFHWFCR